MDSFKFLYTYDIVCCYGVLWVNMVLQTVTTVYDLITALRLDFSKLLNKLVVKYQPNKGTF